MDCVNDMLKRGINAEMTADRERDKKRRERKKETCCAEQVE